jgi:preprotein translocase subunit SecA
MLDNFIKTIFGSQHDRDLKALLPILHSVNEKETWAAGLPAEKFPKQTERLRERYRNGETLDSLLPEAFSLAREAARRNLGERPYDVQVLGSIVLHQGKIVEMKTGEGKTLMSVLAAYLNAIPRKGIHIVTVNDYLAGRDAEWMRPIFDYLGMTVGTILSDMDNAQRKENYACDITYGTNNEFGFDYLRDNMHRDMKDRVQRGHNYCIVDEIDSILIDEARTPLIISGPTEDDTSKYAEVNQLLDSLKEVERKEDDEYPDETQGEEVIGDYKMNEKNKSISFTNQGLATIEELLQERNLIQGAIVDGENFEYIHYFTQALKAHKHFHIDVDYVVQGGQVQIVDEFTGRILHGRRYSDGLHQAIEAKEGMQIAQRNRTLATITFQNYFRLYAKISGMTGTADTEAVEFAKIYKLEVMVIPTNLPVARLDENDLVYLNEADKYQALCDEIAETHKKGQPMLVGTISIEKSEKISTLLNQRGIRHEVLNAKNHDREALIIAEAGAKGSITIATNMAGRGTDIKLGGNPEHRARRRAGTDATPEQYAEIYQEEYEKWKEDYEEVKSLGGLYVIGTERHESRRIDNQLRGRSGRQGDPGESKFFISMDDELMRLFGGERMKNVMSKIGMEPGEPIYHPWLSKSIENAQKKVEDRNFEIRKHLLEYDDVLNKQRKYIYEQRDVILLDTDLRKRVNDATADMVVNLIDEFNIAQREDMSAAVIYFSEELRTKFGYHLEWDPNSVEAKNTELLKNKITSDFEKDIENKKRIIGTDSFNTYIRESYLDSIDRKWLDHLENMEALREAVYLRHYAQKNPLTEYKVDGFRVFDCMIDDIRQEIVSRFHLMRIQVAPAGETRRPLSRTLAASQSAGHRSMDSFGVASSTGPGNKGDDSPMAAASRPDGATVGMEPGEPIPLLNKSIEGTQKEVEERNFGIHKHPLEYDDVLNQQRKYIYEQRDAILSDTDLKKRVNDATADMVGNLIDEFKHAQRKDISAAVKDFSEQLGIKFGYHLAWDPNSAEARNIELLEKKIISDLEKDIDDKEALIGTDYLNAIIRDNYLHFIDRRWLDHLENMEALQKKPITEYKVEGIQIFDRMINDIRQEIASRLHLIRIQVAPASETRRPLSQTLVTSQSADHSSMDSFGVAGSTDPGNKGDDSPMAAESRPDDATVVRSLPKVGRNDPCPCGSGKKYKFCHGR